MTKSLTRKEREAAERRKIIICEKCHKRAIYRRPWSLRSKSLITLAVHCTDCRRCMWCCPSFHAATYWMPSMPGPWCRLAAAGIVRHSESGSLCLGCRKNGKKCPFCGVCLACHLKRGDWSDDDACFSGCGATRADFDAKSSIQ